MGCAKRNDRIAYGGILLAHWKHPLGPKVMRIDETDKVNQGDSTEVMEEHAVVNASINLEVKPVALDDESRLRLAGDTLHHFLSALDDFLLGSDMLLRGRLLLRDRHRGIAIALYLTVSASAAGWLLFITLLPSYPVKRTILCQPMSLPI